MALSAMTSILQHGDRPSEPVSVRRVQVTLDNNYPTGGYTDFKTLFEALYGTGYRILGIAQQNQPAAWQCVWDYSNEKLMVVTEAFAEAGNGTNLATMANVQLLVFAA